MMHVDVVALEVGPDPLIEGLAQRTTAVHEPVDGQRAIIGQVQAVEVALVEPGHVQRGLSHCLGGDSRVRHGSAIVRSLLDERDLLAEVGRLRGALLPGWARADHDQVVLGAFQIPHLAVFSLARRVYQRNRRRERGKCFAVKREGMEETWFTTILDLWASAVRLRPTSKPAVVGHPQLRGAWGKTGMARSFSRAGSRREPESLSRSGASNPPPSEA